MESRDRTSPHIPNSAIITCQDVAQQFSSGRSQTTVLANVNLEVSQGDFFTILGQAGGGKSTLLKLLGGFIQPSADQVLFHGVPLKGITAKIGMVFQENTLYPWLTVEQNIGFGFKIRGKQQAHYAAKVRNVLEHVGLMLVNPILISFWGA